MVGHKKDDPKDTKSNNSKRRLKIISSIVAILLLIASLGLLINDLDGDGISNYEELTTSGFDFTKVDSNDDGISDKEVKKFDLNPEKSYPEDFVKIYKDLEKFNTKSAKNLISIVYSNDDKIDNSESEFLNDIKKIDNLHIVDRLLVNTGKVLNEPEKKNFEIMASISVEHPGCMDGIFEQYLNKNSEDELDDKEIEELEFLDRDEYGIASDLLKGPRCITDTEREYIQLLNSPDLDKLKDFNRTLQVAKDGNVIQTEIEYTNLFLGEAQNRLKGFNKTLKLVEDGDITHNDLEYTKLFLGNDPMNVNPQRVLLDFSKDSKITDGELKGARDQDRDGAITELERKANTDYQNEDTDGDGVPDGPEIIGGYQLMNITDWKGDVYHGANDPTDISWRDPVHKEINLLFINQIGEENFTLDMVRDQIDELRELYRNAPVSNPDGEDGIDLRISYVREENFPEKFIYHPGFGVTYYSNLYNGSNWGVLGGSLSNVDVALSHEAFFLEVAHELGHNIFGQINNESVRYEGGNAHTNSRQGIMYPSWTREQEDYLPEVWDDIEEDGMLGLVSSEIDPGNKYPRKISFRPVYQFGGDKVIEVLLSDQT